MKQWYKSNLAKVILVVVAHIMAVVMTVSVIRIISYPVFQEEIFEGGHAKTFEDTKIFERMVWEQSFDVVDGVRWADMYETDGVYNPDKIVDIQEFDTNRTVSGENSSGFAYRLGDIVDWRNKLDATGEEIYENAYEKDTENPVIVCQKSDDTYQYYRYAEFVEMIKAGELSFVLNDAGFDWASGEGETELLNRLRDDYGSDYSMEEDFGGNFKGLQDKEGKIVFTNCWCYDGYAMPPLSDSYAPVGYENLLDMVNQNPDWNGRLSDASGMVDGVLDALGNNYYSYEDINAGIQEGDTNYSYIYADVKTGRVFSNKSEFQSFKELDKNIEKLKASGKYIIVKPKLKDFETNIKNADARSWKDEMIAYGNGDFQEVVLAVHVDTGYPIQDRYYTEHQMFEKYGAGAGSVLSFGLVAGILFLACVVWLTMIAGRSTKDNEVHLNWFDRWKTEIAAVLVIGLWWLGMFLALSLSFGNYGMVTYSGSSYSSDYVANSAPYMVAGAVVAVFTCALFLVGYLSLVRRIKARTMWKNSLLYAIGKFIKKVFDNLPSLWKIILLFLVFVFAHWLAILMAASMWLPVELYMFFLFIVEGAAFVLLVLQTIGKEKIKQGIKKIAEGELDYKIPLDKLIGKQKEIAEAVNCIGDGLDAAVEKSIKSERLKTDLITNVSHDIKTPLTSIINYVELLKQENFKDPKVQRYIEVLEQKAQRLKTLTEDVVEASKVSSGNITLEYMNINLVEMIQQTSGEFEEKFAARGLKEVLSLPEEDALISVDGRRTWRILENIYNNAAKYAMPGSRVYGDLTVTQGAVIFSLKNVSEQPLNISADELTERFIRGDISRSTEGSGLGLSIAKTLTEMQKGTFELYLDGDLFKVTIAFPRVRTS